MYRRFLWASAQKELLEGGNTPAFYLDSHPVYRLCATYLDRSADPAVSVSAFVAKT